MIRSGKLIFIPSLLFITGPMQIFKAICVVRFQPDDHGLIGDVPVLRVTRQGPEAVHFVTSPLEEGQEVKVKVDWERRFDHMQQHSGE